MFRNSSEQYDSADRNHHRASQSLNDTRHHQLCQRAGERAGQRAEGKEGNGGNKYPARAVAVCSPATDGYEHRDRDQVRRNRDVHTDRI